MTSAEPPTAAFNPFSPEFRDDPYPSYRAMRDAGPVIRTPFGSLMGHPLRARRSDLAEFHIPNPPRLS
jgi:hypothetical protein